MASGSEMTFDGVGLDELEAVSRAAAMLVPEEVDKTLVEIGEMVAETARTVAGRYSKSIPPTIHVLPASGYVDIQAGSETVALAALYEKGNAGKGGGRIRMATKTKTGKDTTRSAFRHPVFGDMDVWVAQARHPFFRPALTANRMNIKWQMLKTYTKALEPFQLVGSDEGTIGDDLGEDE